MRVWEQTYFFFFFLQRGLRSDKKCLHKAHTHITASPWLVPSKRRPEQSAQAKGFAAIDAFVELDDEQFRAAVKKIRAHTARAGRFKEGFAAVTPPRLADLGRHRQAQAGTVGEEEIGACLTNGFLFCDARLKMRSHIRVSGS